MSELETAASRGRMPALKTLNLGGNPLGDGGVSRLCGGLISAPALQALHLCRVGAAHDGAAALAELLENSGTLEEIDFSWNNVGPKGARALQYPIRCGEAVWEGFLGYA